MEIKNAVVGLAKIRSQKKKLEVEEKECTGKIHSYMKERRKDKITEEGITILREIGKKTILSREKAEELLTPEMIEKITKVITYPCLKIK